MKRFYIILILSTLFFSCKKSHTAREFFDLACGYENNGETELAMTTYRQALDAARNESDTALLGLAQQYMGMLLLYIQTKINLRKRKEELKLKDEILKFENEVLRLNEIKDDYKRNLEWKYMLVYSMTLMDRNKSNSESHYKMIKGRIYHNSETAFDTILKIFNEEHPGLAEQIKEKYPTLSDTEYKVGIMSLTPFNSQETADILGKSINTINKARTSIRKKLEIEENESIEEAISGQMSAISCQPSAVSN